MHRNEINMEKLKIRIQNRLRIGKRITILYEMFFAANQCDFV